MFLFWHVCMGGKHRFFPESVGYFFLHCHLYVLSASSFWLQCKWKCMVFSLREITQVCTISRIKGQYITFRGEDDWFLNLDLCVIAISHIFETLATTARFARLRGSLRLRGFQHPFWNKILKTSFWHWKLTQCGKCDNIQSYPNVLHSAKRNDSVHLAASLYTAKSLISYSY